MVGPACSAFISPSSLAGSTRPWRPDAIFARERKMRRFDARGHGGADGLRLKSGPARASLHRIVKFRRTQTRSGAIQGEHVKVNTLAAALKTEVRRLAAKEVQRGLRQVRTLQRQIKKLRLAARAHRRNLRAMERTFGRLAARMPTGGRR